MSVLILIPARMSSERLPGKPLADIAGLPMIERVRRQAVAAEIGDVVVATDSTDVFETITDYGGRAVMTRSDHPSGSDRIFEALTLCDPDGSFDCIVNVQGDLPDIDPAAIALAARILDNPDVDIATLAAIIMEEDERNDPNVVKAVGSPVGSDEQEDFLRALYFTRAPAPSGDGPLYHHIGLYAYRRAALERFVSLPPSVLERRERLEQLRALEAGMRIDIGIVDAVPLGVDTPADLEKARRRIAG